jgi:hypothetical protein
MSKSGSRQVNTSKPWVITLAIIALVWCCSVTQADNALEAACKQITHAVGKCSCVVSFLKQNIGDKQALLLMTSWAISLRRSGDGDRALENFYRVYEIQQQAEAAWSFHKVLIAFQAKCHPPASDLWDLE